MSDPQIERHTKMREDDGFSFRGVFSKIVDHWRPLKHTHREEFLAEQFRATRAAVRAAMVVGASVFAFRGVMDWANGLTAAIWWHEVAWRGAFLLVQAFIIAGFNRSVSVKRGEIMMSIFAASLIIGMIGVNVLNDDRTAYSLFPIAFVCLLSAALWPRLKMLMWTLGVALAPVILWMLSAGMADLDRKSYAFYIPLAIILGIVIRHGRQTTAFDAFLLRRHLAAQALNDPLTGVLNRAGWKDRLAANMKGGAPPRPSSLLFFDLDKFKAINDNHGHPVGDLIIQATADKVQSILRENDILARFGGEEFVVFLPGLDVSKACMVAERVRVAIEQIKDPVPVTVSIGVSEFRPGETVEEAMERADNALLEAKQQGRNRVLAAA